MTLFGMLHRRADPKTVYKSFAFAAVAKAEGVDFVFFTPRDVDFTKGTVAGKVYVDGQWSNKTTPLPDVIYNNVSRFSSEAEREIVHRLRGRIPFTTHGKRDKMRVHERLCKDPIFADHLLPTERLTNPEQVFNFLARYSNVIVKPIHGNKGRGVSFIKRRSDGFSLLQGQKRFDCDEQLLIDWIQTEMGKERLLIQPYVSSITKMGFSYDIRIHVQKNGWGQWVIPFVFPRIGLKGRIVTNLSTGGYTAFPDRFFEEEYGEQATNMKTRLERFALSLAVRLENIYDVSFDEFGIDVGVDTDHNIWLYEVNWRPGLPPIFFLQLDVVKNAIRYAEFLAQMKT